MAHIWQFGCHFDTHMALAAPRADGQPPIEVIHHLDAGDHYEIGINGGNMGSSLPIVATLILRQEGFDADFFTWGGTLFVSAKLRQVMALDPDDVRYLDIDDEGSAPLARSKTYKIMDPMRYERVFDPAASAYSGYVSPEEQPYGPISIQRLALRPDAAPGPDLFYDDFFATVLLCSDAFAARVLHSGCTGMEFIQAVGRGGEAPLRFRSLRGVEAVVRDPATGETVNELIEPIG